MAENTWRRLCREINGQEACAAKSREERRPVSGCEALPQPLEAREQSGPERPPSSISVPGRVAAARGADPLTSVAEPALARPLESNLAARARSLKNAHTL